jgi:hypothetical protein
MFSGTGVRALTDGERAFLSGAAITDGIAQSWKTARIGAEERKALYRRR